MTALQRIAARLPDMVARVTKSRAAAMRVKCLECCNGSVGEVAKCAIAECPLHPWRLGRAERLQVDYPPVKGSQ